MPFTWVVAGLAVLVLVIVGLRLGPLAPPRSGSSPTPGGSASPPLVTPPLPECAFGDLPAARSGYRQWATTFVDTTYGLSRTYVPPDLVPASGAGFSHVFQVRSVVLADLDALRRGAEAAGSPIELEAAYRSYEQQASLFAERASEFGGKAARVKTARPGHSEHQLGTTVDFKSAGDADVDIFWEGTPAGAWVAKNAWRYGFVQSYPKAKEDVTCYAFEPWHYRYVGRPLAGKVHESGLSLREYLWRLVAPKQPA